MLRLWDYGCSCGKEYRGYSVTEDKTPKTIKCSCGKKAEWIMGKTNGIHATHTGMKYGEFDPQFGCVVESYGHKKKLMKEMGLVDIGGPETRDDIERHGESIPDNEQDPNVIRAESMEEILNKTPADQVDWKHTGRPNRPMQDMWVKFEGD